MNEFFVISITFYHVLCAVYVLFLYCLQSAQTPEAKYMQ